MIQRWMSWEGCVDLCAATEDGFATPNVIIHVARMVHTPIGSAPGGMLLWQPDPAAAPVFVGFVSADPKVGAYFGPQMFAGTQFEKTKVFAARIQITVSSPRAVAARVEVAGRVFEVTLADIDPVELVDREPGAASPYRQVRLEAPSPRARLRVDGKEIPLVLPPAGIWGGPAAAWSPTGLDAR